MNDVGEATGYSFRVFLELLRPFTLLAPIIVSSSVMIASLVYTGMANLSLLSIVSTICIASVCFASLNGASNVLNQVTDRKEDALSKPYRPIPRGVITHRQAYTVSFILYTASLLLSLSIHPLFSFFIFIIACFSLSYSLPPRMKRYLFINQLWVALPRGFFAILASWSVFGNPFTALPLAMGCIAAIYLFGGTVTKDVLDAEADRIVGTRTFVNVYGVKPTAYFSLFCMLGAFSLIIPFIFLHVIDDTFFPLVFLGFFSIVIGWLMVHNQKNAKHENISAWTLMYVTYFMFAIGFSALTISFST